MIDRPRLRRRAMPDIRAMPDGLWLWRRAMSELVPSAKPSKKVVMSQKDREEKAKPKPSKRVPRASCSPAHRVPKQPPEFPPPHLMQHAPSDCLTVYIDRKYSCCDYATKMMLRLVIRRGGCDHIPQVLKDGEVGRGWMSGFVVRFRPPSHE